MSIGPQLPAEEDSLLLSSILFDQRQRQLLAALHEEATPLTERDLAVLLAAGERDTSASEVTELERQQLRVALHHRYLPKLEQAGLIERRVDGIVATGELALEDTERTRPRSDDPVIPSWEALEALHARPRRQRIVSALAGHRDPLALEDLAAQLARDESSRTADGGVDDPGLQATLHHVDLPKLDDVGLIDYDSDKRIVVGEPELSTFDGQTDDGTTGRTDTES